MNFGGPELGILLFVAAAFLASIAVPIYAAVKAFNGGENAWGIGILIAMLVPFGFILAIVYLVQRRDVA